MAVCAESPSGESPRVSRPRVVARTAVALGLKRRSVLCHLRVHTHQWRESARQTGTDRHRQRASELGSRSPIRRGRERGKAKRARIRNERNTTASDSTRRAGTLGVYVYDLLCLHPSKVYAITIYGFRERTARRRRPVDASGYETLSVKITVHHKSGGRMNHGFRMSFHGCVTIRDVIIDVM